LDNLVSVIIPTYKRPYWVLMRAVKSVLDQSYTNLEVIIVDDSGTNDTNRNDVENEIRKITDHRVRYIQHAYNQGACKARNTGIENSRGNYIAFLDDDDEWLPNKLELQLKKMDASQAGLVYCDYYAITLKDDIQVKKDVRAHRISGWVYDELILRNFIGSTSFVLLKKEVLDSCGNFNESMKSAQDFELWLRISKKYEVDYVDTPLVNYYVHGGERITSNVDSQIQGHESINALNMDYLATNPKVLCMRRLKLVHYYAVKNCYKTALLKWFDAVKIYPFQIENLLSLLKVLVILKNNFIFLRKNMIR